MAQLGSSCAARANERDDSSWLNAHSNRMPWSKYACASFEDVVTLRWKLPRPVNSSAPSAHWSSVVGAPDISAVAGLIAQHSTASALPQSNVACFILTAPPASVRQQSDDLVRWQS